MSGRVHVLLTGSPGVGKTTLVKSIIDLLGQDEDVVPVRGFYTEELRQHGVRVGFDVVTVDGQRAALSREASSGQPRVGKYVVDVRSFEDISLRALAMPPTGHSSTVQKVVMVIDEIGKMEMFSRAFQQAVKETFSRTSCVVLATIPLSKGPKTIPLVEQLVARQDTKLYKVTVQNRDSLVRELVGVIQNSVSARPI